MASYHSSFEYLGKNSLDEGFIICAFEPDDGLVDSFLSMEQVYTDSYDNTKRFLYGTKYDSVATINITIIKADGSDISVEDNRKIFRWLTGCRKASWLDLHEGDMLKYSFYCTTQNIQQYKLDSRVIGFTITFESIHPWAWSALQEVNFYVGADAMEMDSGGLVYKSVNAQKFGFSEGVLYNAVGTPFKIDDNGVIYNDVKIDHVVDNQTDDLYTYINLDVEYKSASNGNNNAITISNLSTNETTEVSNIGANEMVALNAGQFIVSYSYDKTTDTVSGQNINKIFGNAFNFIWPRLQPGSNQLEIQSVGRCNLKLSYRYPIKIGDCAIDVDKIDYSKIC